jgi:hypothetical protein
MPALVAGIHVFDPIESVSDLILRRIARAIRLEGDSRVRWSLFRDAASRLLLRMRGEYVEDVDHRLKAGDDVVVMVVRNVNPQTPRSCGR